MSFDVNNNTAAGQQARHPGGGSSWAPPAPGRAVSSRTTETASLHSVRKRSSFFGRSNSDASSMRRAPATSHSTKSSFSGPRIDEDGSRPQTSSSSDMRRRKTDPLQSIRDSIFGGKKKGARDATDASGSRPGSRGNDFHDGPVHGGCFASEEDYYRNLRKHSISPPFNFQHVTHTARNQLPQLDTVDEKDLPGQFWSVAAYQKPRRRVHGIKVDDLEARHRQMGLIKESPEPSPAFSPPVSPVGDLPPSQPSSLAIPRQAAENDLRLISPIPPVSPLDSQVSGAACEQVFNPAPEAAIGPVPTPSISKDGDIVRHPRRQSSLGALDQQVISSLQKPSDTTPDPSLRSQESFYDSNSSSEGESRKVSPSQDTRKPPKPNVPKLNASMPPNFSQDYDVAFRARQPLPSLPPQPARPSKSSPNLLQVANTPPLSMLSPTLPPAHPPSPKSKRSSKSSRSARQSPSVSTTSGPERKPSMFTVSDASWEDSVDMAYEEEAEATCDFTWGGQQQARNSIVQRSDSKRDSAATVYHAESPDLSNEGDSVISLYRNSSTDTVNDRKSGEVPHKRGSSVGHRGFLAARKNSSTPDLLSKAKEPPAPLTFSQASTQVSVLSPVFSVADEDAQKTPFTPADLHYPHIERVSNDYLSDPESYRNSHSSKHRKSSSYGSYGSYDSAGTRATGPPTSSSNPTRWSIASSGSSVPELMHSRPKSKSSLSRSVTSQPLETLPQSPPDSGTEAEFGHGVAPTSVPQQPESARNTFVRSSAGSSDRVMQAAGRLAQRGRPGSYARYSQHLEPSQAVPKGGVRESLVQGPEWI